jgi:hypothetical protein
MPGFWQELSGVVHIWKPQKLLAVNVIKRVLGTLYVNGALPQKSDYC